MVRKPNAAFMAKKDLSAELEAVVGKGPMARSEIVSEIWKYIKKHGLQNPKNKRNVLADEKLQKVFGGKKEVTMFEMAGFISKNIK